MSWETVIGLEVHAQLATASKIFSGASTKYGASPNTQASLVDLGYPGVLPVLNGDAVRMAVKARYFRSVDIDFPLFAEVLSIAPITRPSDVTCTSPMTIVAYALNLTHPCSG